MNDTFTPLTLPELTEELATTFVLRESINALLRDHGVDDTTEALRLVDTLADNLHDEYINGADIPTLIGLIHGDLRRDADRYITEEVEHFLNTHANTDRKACAAYAALNAWDTEPLNDAPFVADKQRIASTALPAQLDHPPTHIAPHQQSVPECDCRHSTPQISQPRPTVAAGAAW